MLKSKSLALTIPLMVLLVGLVIYQYGFQKIRSDLNELKDAETVKVKTLEKYMALIAERPELEKKLAGLKETKKSEHLKLVEGQTHSIAAARLQDIAKSIITSRGGTVSSERPGKPDDFGKFKMITVTMDIIVPDTRALSDIIYSMETQTPYLVVKELDSRIRNFREPRDLMVRLDVTAVTSGE